MNVFSGLFEKKYLYDNVFDGFLFVGDPHQTSGTPDNRIDSLNFKFVALRKLTEAVSIANNNNLLMVILGDLFHKNNDFEASITTSACLSKSKFPAVVLGGNHDEKTDIVSVKEISFLNNFSSSDYSADDMLSFLSDVSSGGDEQQTKLYSNILKAQSRSAIHHLKASKTIILADSSGYIGSIKTSSGVDYNLFGTPYGEPVPHEIDCDFDGRNFLITHHDFDFGLGLSYRNCEKMHPINNCYMVVNGHIHDFKKVQSVGDTLWFNPGNILRLSKDLEGHVPSVFSFTENESSECFEDTGCENIKRYVLSHAKKVFRTNEALDAIDRELKKAIREGGGVVKKSSFAEQLMMMIEAEKSGLSNDEMIEKHIDSLNNSTEKKILMELYSKAKSSKDSISK